jgi:hypothetical protein
MKLNEIKPVDQVQEDLNEGLPQEVVTQILDANKNLTEGDGDQWATFDNVEDMMKWLEH